MPTINFRPGVDPTQLSAHSREVFEHLLTVSGNPSLVITCGGRTPAHQAQAMHDNLMRGVSEGLSFEESAAKQKQVYSRADGTPLPGCAVIDVWLASRALSAEDTLAAMTAKIVELGPEHVSKHCADPAQFGTYDVAQSSLANPGAFRDAARSHTFVDDVAQCLDENGCLHCVIPQPISGASGV